MEHRCPAFSVFGVFQPECRAGDRVSAAVGFGDGYRAGDTGVFAPNLDLLSVRSHGENIWCRICLVAVRGFQLFEIVVAEGDVLKNQNAVCVRRPFGKRISGAVQKPESRVGQSLSAVLVHLLDRQRSFVYLISDRQRNRLSVGSDIHFMQGGIK